MSSTLQNYHAREVPSAYDPGFLKTEHQSIQRAIASTQTLATTGAIHPVFNVWEYPAKLVSGADWLIPIRQAVADAVTAGGTVYFPTPMVYGLSAEVAIASVFTVNLISHMGTVGGVGNRGSYFKPLNNIAGSLFKFTCPGNRSNSSGGLIHGLSFSDRLPNDNPRNYTITSCLDLTDFSLGTVSWCNFVQILGKCIRTENCIESSIKSCRMHFSGDAGKSPLSIESSGGYNTQALTIDDLRSEVNWSAPYISIDSLGQCIKLIGSGFEADQAQALSCQTFVDDLGTQNSYVGNHFNRNTATNVVRIGNRAQFGGNFLSGHSGTSLVVGDNCAVGTNVFYDNLASGQVNAVNFSGAGSSFAGNTGASVGGLTGTGDWSHLNTIGRNAGWATETKGTATVLNGTTSIVVNHGLLATPALQDISVTPTNSMGAATKFNISTVTATQFTISVDANPGATTATFAWSARLG